MNTLYAGLVVWLVTLILVESRLFEPVRRRVAGERVAELPPPFNRVVLQRRRRLGYLVNCHLCTGCWVALGVAFVVPGPLPLLLNALLYKAVGHGVLEVTALLRRTNV